MDHEQLRSMRNAQRCEKLTVSQVECLKLIRDNRTSKEIARSLGISPSAVEQRLQRARLVLGAATSAEAARLYTETCGDSTCEPQAIAPSSVSRDDGDTSRVFEVPDLQRVNAVREERVALIADRPPTRVDLVGRFHRWLESFHADLDVRSGLKLILQLAFGIAIVVLIVSAVGESLYRSFRAWGL